ncbi:MAG: hypothetical protein AVDCRST_MAG59-1437, partial [uncultured Thermomicrobiales bacterium]
AAARVPRGSRPLASDRRAGPLLGYRTVRPGGWMPGRRRRGMSTMPDL